MLLGIVTALLIITTMGFGMHRGWFDRPTVIGVVAALPIALLVVLVISKAWEYTIEPLPAPAPTNTVTPAHVAAKGTSALDNLGHGVNRRLDDVSGNSIVFGTFVGVWCAYAGGTVRMRNRRRSLAFFLTSASLGSAAYLYIVCVVNPGTFCSPATGTVKVLQVLEGVVCLLILALVHLFMARLLTALTWPSYRRAAKTRALVMLAGLGAAVFAWLQYLPVLIGMADKTTYGMLASPPLSDLVKFSLAIWWPLLFVCGFVIIATFQCAMRSGSKQHPAGTSPSPPSPAPTPPQQGNT